MSLIQYNAEYLNQHINLEFAAGLIKILEYLEKENISYNTPKLRLVLDTLSEGKASPHVFACYFDIAINLKAGDILGTLNILPDFHHSVIKKELEILPYDLSTLGEDYYRFPKLVFSTFSDSPPIASPKESLFKTYHKKIIDALDIIKFIDISSYQAIHSLVSQIIVGTEKDRNNAFGGASSLMTWGAIFINIKRYQEIPDIVEFIIHELTHHILFGINSVNQLVLNPPDQLFPSALRSDPRPMDGIYHATLVCANICFFMHKWLHSSECQNKIDRTYLSSIFQHNKSAFLEMHMVVDSYARLSKEGRDILDKAQNKLDSLVIHHDS